MLYIYMDVMLLSLENLYLSKALRRRWRKKKLFQDYFVKVNYIHIYIFNGSHFCCACAHFVQNTLSAWLIYSKEYVIFLCIFFFKKTDQFHPTSNITNCIQYHFRQKWTIKILDLLHKFYMLYIYKHLYMHLMYSFLMLTKTREKKG